MPSRACQIGVEFSFIFVHYRKRKAKISFMEFIKVYVRYNYNKSQWSDNHMAQNNNMHSKGI